MMLQYGVVGGLGEMVVDSGQLLVVVNFDYDVEVIVIVFFEGGVEFGVELIGDWLGQCLG